MKFYIPEHLKKLKIIDQVSKVVEAYVPKDDSDSFDDYRWYLQNDPIRRFLGLEKEFPEVNIEDVEDEEEIESAITTLSNYQAEMNYLTKLFYTAKGTKKVIEFAKKFIPSLSQAEITYSPDELKININQLAENIDENLYSQYIEGFFNALLIFKRFTCNINQVNIVIDASLSSAIGVGVQAFQIIRG